MVAPLSSARIGGSGIVLGVGVDVETLRAAIPTLNARIKQISEGLKLKPEIDFEQTAVKRALGKLRSQLTNEIVKVQVQAEAGNLGLAQRPVYQEPPNFDQGFGSYGPSVRGRFGTRDAQFRGAQAAILRGVRNDTARARADETMKAAREAIFGKPYEYIEEPEDVGIHGPAVRGRFSQRESAIRAGAADEIRRMRRETLKAQVRERLFGPEEDEDKPGSGLGSLRGLLRGGAFGYAAHFTGQLANAALDTGRGVGLSMSSDPVLSAQGKLGTLQGLASIPVIGSLFSAFDKLTGASEALNEKIKTRLALEGFGVASAQVGGDQFSIARAETVKAHIDLVREREKIEIEGDQSLERAQKVDAFFNGKGIGAAAAVRARTAGLLAGKDLEISNLAKLGGTRMQLLRFDSDTRIGLSEMRVQNRGLHLDDEDALGNIRGVESSIRRATSREGKNRAMLEGVASLRAFRAGLEVRGGGMAAVTNIATDLFGDPYNLNPETQARLRAAGMTDSALGKIGALTMRSDPALGSARARDLGLHMGNGVDGINENQTDAGSQSEITLARILDILERFDSKLLGLN
jgi:hypothetical protein